MSDFSRVLLKILAALGLVGILVYAALSPAWAARPEDVTVAKPTAIPTAEPTPSPSPTPAPTPTPTPEPTPTPTPEPTPEYYTLSFVGDCTLSSYPEIRGRADAFEAVVGDDTAYPFSNTVDIFAQDEMTLVNLECSLSDLEGWSASTFSFLAPASAVDILTDGSVEFATMANNHARDFGQAIYDDTAAVLDGAGIGHAGEGEGVLYTTDNGLVVGIYAVHNGHYPDANAVAQAVRDLKEAGAEIVVVSAHWGNEASYYQNENQTAVAHAAIDAGASIVVGHGPHRLQPMEEYNGGVIFYSLSNWVFGGNTLPADMDTVIGQVTIRRDLDGTLSVDSFQAIPCRISSRTDTNDYCPTLLEEGSEEYARALSKVTGEWTGSNDVIDYSFMHPEEG